MVWGISSTAFGERKVQSAVSEPRVPNDKTLVEAAKRGHSPAFADLCGRYSQQLFRAAHRITGSREDAEDAVQNALLSAFTHMKSFDGRSSFGTWLTRIAINSALMMLRKRRSWHEVYVDDSVAAAESQSFWEMPDSSPSAEDVYLQRELQETLRRAVASLRPGIRKVVEGGTLQGQTMKETAGIMGITTAAAKARLFHARRTLRNSRALRTVYQPRPAKRSRLAAAA